MITLRTSSLFIIIILIILISISCKSDIFKESSMEINKLLLKADKLVKESKVENIYENGKPKSIKTTFDKSESKKFLDSQKEDFYKHYEVIKKHVDNRTEKYIDAVYILININGVTFLLTGEPIADNCKYLEMVKKEKDVLLSNWVQNDIFAPFLNIESTIKKWRNMSSADKQKDIYNYSMSFYNQLDKCSDSNKIKKDKRK